MNHKACWIGLVALVALAGCNREEGSGGSAAAGGAASKLKVVFIPKSTGNSYFDEVGKGFAEAAKEIGADYATTAPAKADASDQIPIIKDQVQRGVDVIALAADSPDALDTVLDDARSKGVTVITVDADLAGNETHRDAGVLPADFGLIGPGQIELLGSLIGYEGDFAILSATTDAPNQNAWIATMKDTLKQPKYAKMNLVETVYGDDEAQKSTTECEALLAKHPNLRGIIAPTSVGLPACAQVLDRTGTYPGGPHAVGKGIQLTGLSAPNQMKKFVDSGVVTKFQLWAPANMGYLAVYLGQQIHSKKLTPTVGGEFTTPKFGPGKFGDKMIVLGGPVVTFDKSNIAKFDF